MKINKDDSLFAQLKAVRAPIYIFSTQFFDGDLNFTVKLHDAVPDVSILRLTEAPAHNADVVGHADVVGLFPVLNRPCVDNIAGDFIPLEP